MLTQIINKEDVKTEDMNVKKLNAKQKTWMLKLNVKTEDMNVKIECQNRRHEC